MGYLLAARDLADFKARFRQDKVRPAAGPPRVQRAEGGLLPLPLRLVQKWLRFSTDPTLVMLCYVWLAQCEVQDLDHIIEGVHYKLPPEEVQSLLVGFDEND